MEAKRTYWLVIEGGEMAQKIAAAEAQHAEFVAACRSLKAEFNASGMYTYDNHSFCGLQFGDGKIPEGWRPAAREDFCVPNRKSNAGRAIAARIKTFPRGMDGFEFSRIVGHSDWCSKDSKVYFPNYEKIAGKTVFSMSANLTESPVGCTPLKASEYWQIKEQADESEAKS